MCSVENSSEFAFAQEAARKLECLFVRRADSKEIAEYDEQMKDFKYQRVVEITKKM